MEQKLIALVGESNFRKCSDHHFRIGNLNIWPSKKKCQVDQGNVIRYQDIRILIQDLIIDGELILKADGELKEIIEANGGPAPVAFSREWETVCDLPTESTMRMKIHGGWIVKHYEHDGETDQCSGVSITTVSDPKHQWILEPTTQK